ncbi:MAG: cation transporter [Acidobacteriota bacterium]
MKIVVKGMTCDHCARTVTKALESLHGVTNVSVNVGTGAVSFDDADGHGVEEIRDAIEDSGYEMIAP